MKDQKVTLSDMLLCRERRAAIQIDFLETYNCPVLSFCMNIPGPIKINSRIQAAFLAGKKEIYKQFQELEITIVDSVEFNGKTGNELLLAADAPAAFIKEITANIEDQHSLGRLFDMDVLDIDGHKLSRSNYRKCMICDCQAQECSRSRKHSVLELQQKVKEILDLYLKE